ncbi:MAG: 4-hydroxyphenylpyruvate dioxygenase [Bacteroidota bacterium]
MQTSDYQLIETESEKTSDDFLPINGTDYLELYVGNARQSAHFFQTALGFQPLAYSGLSTGVHDRESYVLAQDKIRLVLTTPLLGNTEIGKHIDLHGDGVKAIALWVDDAEKAFFETTKRGAETVFEPVVEKDSFGSTKKAAIKTYGDTIHIFVERKDYSGVFLPNFKAWNPTYQPSSVGLKYIDHCVGNVGWHEMNIWTDFYAKVMGFNQLVSFDDKDIATEYTALMSKVMSNGNGKIKFPINEPAEGKKKSQIEEYLNFYGGAGVQHIAVATDDIISTVLEMQKRGIEFLQVPDSYYDTLLERVGNIDEHLVKLQNLGILVDRDEDGYLLQIFTKPIVSRPTLFFEIIQRKGAKSFGKGNFKALFEAIEREQILRGTL